MPKSTSVRTQPEYHEYLAWDAPTRLFHWINALAVIGLIATGLVILSGKPLGLSTEGKIALKSVHVSARWRAILPGGAGFMGALRAYVASFLSGGPQQYVGHNPLARLGVSLLFLLLLVQMATGLVLAGTDLFWPPFGRLFAIWIAAPGIDPAVIQPGASSLIDEAAYQSMRDFRAPFVEIHEITFYMLAIAIVVHLMAVVVTEVHEGGGITSAMFTGRKILTSRPPDAPAETAEGP